MTEGDRVLLKRARAAVTAAAAALVFAFSWLFRFNDPGGAFAGLTDDHFFYVIRGWQILFGDLPVRDFVDHGAPLYYYVAAAVQMLFGRGTLSEVAFSVTVLSAGAALTFWLATRASGSILAGLVAAAFHILLEPRLYNYPKILVYAAAIPLLWWFADRPGPAPRFSLAVATAVAFLLRHDHGVFVAAGLFVLLAACTHLQRRERVRHAVIYVALVAALLAPYLAFIQVNGGVLSYFRHASAWAARDRERAPLAWPGLVDNPHGASHAARDDPPPAQAVAVVRDNIVAWTYYLELALPLLALGLVALSRDGFTPGPRLCWWPWPRSVPVERVGSSASAGAGASYTSEEQCRPRWPHAVPKLQVVVALAVVLNAGFLRSPLAARLADPSVPHAILLAWLLAALVRLLVSRESLRPSLRPHAVPIRVAACAALAPFVFVVAIGMSADLHRRLEKAALTGPLEEAFDRVEDVRRQLVEEWRLDSWRHREDRPDLVNLSLYLDACTRPDDRVLMQHYAPQVLALARRGFAGGHADLRPGFFNTQEAQALTIERLARQRVPLVLLETGNDYVNFRASFPFITAYLDEHYTLAGTHVFDRRFGVQLFVRKGSVPLRRYEPLGWPCFS